MGMKKDTNNVESLLPVYVINLKKDHNKLAHMQMQFTQLGLKYSRIEAIDGTCLDRGVIEMRYSEPDAIRTMGRRLTLPELGTVFSHLSVYETIIEQQIDMALILEDDIIIDPTLLTVLGALGQLPSGWEVVLLGHHPEYSLYRDANSSFWGSSRMGNKLKCIRFSEFPFGAYGYLISRNGARKLMHALQKICEPIDHYTGNEALVNLYGVSPACIRVHQGLFTQSNLSEERDRLNTLTRKTIPRHIRLLKKIPGLVPGLKQLRRFLLRCIFNSHHSRRLPK